MSLLLAFLLLQNITISGTLRNTEGKTVSGVRVAAMPVGETFFYGTTYTDKDGHYTLDLPPGAYYVVAGYLLRPTYYTVIGSKVAVSGSRDRVDFAVNATPLLRPVELPEPLQWDVPPAPPKLLPR